MSIGSWTRLALLVAALLVLIAPAHAAEQLVRTAPNEAAQPCSVEHATPASEVRDVIAAVRAQAGSSRTLVAPTGAEPEGKSGAATRSWGKTLAACTVVHCCGRRVSCCGKQDCKRKCPCWP